MRTKVRGYEEELRLGRREELAAHDLLAGLLRQQLVRVGRERGGDRVTIGLVPVSAAALLLARVVRHAVPVVPDLLVEPDVLDTHGAAHRLSVPLEPQLHGLHSWLLPQSACSKQAQPWATKYSTTFKIYVN